MSDKPTEEKKGEEAQGTRRTSARVAARAAKEEVKETTSSTKKRVAAKEKKQPRPSKKAKLSEEDELEGDSENEELPEPIAVGDNLPTLTLKNEKGEDVDVAQIAEEQGVVIFLVPKADTPGCTRQACGFRDSFQEIKDLNFAVYCLSADSPTAQAKWQNKKSLPYSLLSDPTRRLITALGAGEGGKTKRSHYIFEKGGKLLEKKLPVKPDDSPTLALQFIKGLKSE